MSIEAAIFDIGNVLVRFDWGPAEEQIRSRMGHQRKEAREEFTALKNSFELGALSREAFLQEVIRILDFRGHNDEFVAIWNGIFSPNEVMEELIAHLKGVVPLYLLSNTSELHLAYLEERFQILQNFVDGVYSFRARCAKPGREIFTLAARQFGVRPSRTIFVDDLEQNVRSAADYGFQVFHYNWRKHAEFRDKLGGFGLVLR